MSIQTSVRGFTYFRCSRAQNIETVIVGRFLNGAFGSTGATMVGGRKVYLTADDRHSYLITGTIADIWATHEYV